MRLLIAVVIVIAVVMLFQGAFNPSGARPRSQAYGPSGGAY